MHVITIVLILMEAIIVLVWMDMSWNQIITLAQVMMCCYSTKLTDLLHMHNYMYDWSCKNYSVVYHCSFKISLKVYTGRI